MELTKEEVQHLRNALKTQKTTLIRLVNLYRDESTVKWEKDIKEVEVLLKKIDQELPV